MKNQYYEDAIIFSEILKKTRLKSTAISFGNFLLPYKRGVSSKIQYNEDGIDMLDNKHEYTVKLYQSELQLSLQLYENVSNHFRLFAFTRVGNIQGMTFSINLTTERESDNIIFLTQKIKFSELRNDDKEIAALKRRQKQILLCEVYRKMGFDVTENNDLILGIFDPNERKFVNTSPESFLNNFIAVSILKGHFQGNKGYDLDIIPNYQNIVTLDTSDQNISKDTILPDKVLQQKSKRIIPLAFRYKVLKRDNSKCVACGRGVNDGVTLHIDHKIPFSLGGLTELDNLQTLCSECNISKSNRFIDI